MCGGEKKGKKRNAAPRAWRIKKEGKKKGKKEKKMKWEMILQYFHNKF